MSPKLPKFLAATLLVIFLGEAPPVRAANPEHVKRLLETKECSGCDLSRANLNGANLSFAILVNANLMGANLKGANLSNADLTRANLSEADLRQANLSEAYLGQANLNKAFLTNANLDRTNLIGASISDLRGIGTVALSSAPSGSVAPLAPRRALPSISISPLPRPQPMSLQTLPLLQPATPSPPRAPLLETIPQLTEAQNYLRARWKPPADLKQTLEYSLLLNADGTIQRLIPLGDVAATYIEHTGIPLPGEPFVSPIEGGAKPTILVVLPPDGNVQVFLWEK